MPQAIRIHETGGPEVLRWEPFDPGAPGTGEVRVRHEAVGLNFIDIYHRTGLYPLPSLPAVIGMEGAGIVEETGEGVTEFRTGDRVAYAAVPPGAYAEVRCIPSHRLVKLPDTISSQQAAAMMLQGMTARYLIRGCYDVKPGVTLLIHAAAGGVGSIVCQWAKHLGATVIGTVGTAEKADRVRALGCDYPIQYTQEDFAARVKEITGGNGVDVVYDSVGQATFAGSLDCLRPMGLMVSFGQSSGSVPPFDLGVLGAKGSLFLTRPSLGHYTASDEEIQARTKEIFDWMRSGSLNLRIDRTFSLSDAAEAHRYLEDRQTRGKLLLDTRGPQAPLTPDRTIDVEDSVDESSWESFPASDPPAF